MESGSSVNNMKFTCSLDYLMFDRIVGRLFRIRKTLSDWLVVVGLRPKFVPVAYAP